MTDELKHAVERLRALSPKLNKTTDDANRTVQTVEKFLVEECSIGLVAQVDEPGYMGKSPYYQIGFDRLDGKFRIVVTTVQWFSDDQKPVSQNADDADRYTEEVAAWASCPRAVKLRTLPLLPSLLEKLASEAEQAIETTDEAVNAIHSLIGAIANPTSDSSKAIEIDSAMLYSAISTVEDGPATGYLDRETGNVYWLLDDRQRPGVMTEEVVEEWESKRGEIESNRKRFVEIPKFPYDSRSNRAGAEEKFISEFLKKNKISAVVI